MGVNLRATLPAILKARRMTQDELAEKTGIRRTDINALANGRIEAGTGRLSKIAAALEISPAELAAPPAVAELAEQMFGDRLRALEAAFGQERTDRDLEQAALLVRLADLEEALEQVAPGLLQQVKAERST